MVRVLVFICLGSECDKLALETIKASCIEREVRYNVIDIEKERNVFMKYRITTTPTAVFLKNGVEVRRVVGSQKKETYNKVIESL